MSLAQCAHAEVQIAPRSLNGAEKMFLAQILTKRRCDHRLAVLTRANDAPLFFVITFTAATC
jgi:hypothetical protein